MATRPHWPLNLSAVAGPIRQGFCRGRVAGGVPHSAEVPLRQRCSLTSPARLRSDQRSRRRMKDNGKMRREICVITAIQLALLPGLAQAQNMKCHFDRMKVRSGRALIKGMIVTADSPPGPGAMVSATFFAYPSEQPIPVVERWQGGLTLQVPFAAFSEASSAAGSLGRA